MISDKEIDFKRICCIIDGNQNNSNQNNSNNNKNKNGVKNEKYLHALFNIFDSKNNFQHTTVIYRDLNIDLAIVLIQWMYQV